jgi:hypothetical protein
MILEWNRYLFIEFPSFIFYENPASLEFFLAFGRTDGQIEQTQEALHGIANLDTNVRI